MINIILSKGNYKNIAIKIEGFTPESIADSYLLKPYLNFNDNLTSVLPVVHYVYR